MQSKILIIVQIVFQTVVLALTALLVSSCASTHSSTIGSISEVSTYGTPGKLVRLFDSQKPAEQVIARKEGIEYVLKICLNSHRDSVLAYSELSFRLTQSEWDSIIDIVRQYDLTDFVPLPQTQNTIDFGSCGFFIQGVKRIDRSWTNSLKNDGGPRTLADMLARLARRRLPWL